MGRCRNVLVKNLHMCSAHLNPHNNVIQFKWDEAKEYCGCTELLTSNTAAPHSFLLGW